jgi:hypothetical protein
MAGSRLTVHIPQEANPDALIPLLNLMYEQKLSFPDVKTLVAFTKESGLGSRSELQNFAAVCGLLQRNEKGHIALSRDGWVISRLKSDIKADLIHFLMYTGWKDSSKANTELWAYREIVDFLWFRADVEVLSIGPSLNEEVRNKALEMFAADVSFSPKSIRGARKWLSAVTPPVIESESTFSRRHFCPPELALLATGWVAQQTEGELEIDFLLTPERREMICKVCLLDPTALDRVLDWTLPLYPEVMVSGTSAGVYGRFLRLLKWPEMSDLLR